MPLTDEGLEALRTADYLTLVRDALTAELAARGLTGPADYDRDTFLGAVTAVMAAQLGDLSEALQAVYDARDPGNATGVQLSSLAVVSGITRNEATPSTVVLTLAGDAGTEIPQGRTVRGGGPDGLSLWDLQEDAVIGGGGTIDATFVAQVAGATAAIAGTTWELITPVSGWTGATNAADAILGDDRETDDELRIRMQQSVQAGGTASINAIRAKLLELTLDGVQILTAVGVVENVSNIAATIEGISMAPHSVGVVIYPSTISTAQLAVVVRSIYDNVAAGIETSGTSSATVTGLDLLAKTIRWSYPALVGVTVGVVVEVEPPSTTNPTPPTFAEVQPQVEAAIEEYGATLSIGDDVRELPIFQAVAAVEGVRSITVTLTVPLDPGKVQPTGDVLILLSELADLTPDVTEAP